MSQSIIKIPLVTFPILSLEAYYGINIENKLFITIITTAFTLIISNDKFSYSLDYKDYDDDDFLNMLTPCQGYFINHIIKNMVNDPSTNINNEELVSTCLRLFNFNETKENIHENLNNLGCTKLKPNVSPLEIVKSTLQKFGG